MFLYIGIKFLLTALSITEYSLSNLVKLPFYDINDILLLLNVNNVCRSHILFN